MGQSGSWFSRLFSNNATRGLSGDADRVDVGEGAAALFASGLRLHAAEGNLVTHPQRLWDPRGRRKNGLAGHLVSSRGDGIANFTDLLVILNEFDYDEAVETPDANWIENTRNLLEAEAARLAETLPLHRLFPDRPFLVTLLRDWGPEMKGAGFGLQRGQFVTGLLPNLHAGPISTSRPVLAIHACLPGVWDDYRQVGVLYDDHLLFTLGSHWLDNFQHESLRDAAVYRLQRTPDGVLSHFVNPDLAERFTVDSVQMPDGPAVLVLSDLGEPVAYLVLALLDEAALIEEPAPVEEPAPPKEPLPRILVLPPASDRTSETMPFYSLPAPVSNEPASQGPAAPGPVEDASALAAAALAGALDLDAVVAAPAAPLAAARLPVPPPHPPPPEAPRLPPPLPPPPAAPAPPPPPLEPPPPPPPALPEAPPAPVERSAPSPLAAGVTLPPGDRASPIVTFLAPDPSISLSGTTGFGRTIVPDAMDERIFTLRERGVLLQRVHFRSFMEGYDVYLSTNGQLGTAVVDPVGTFQVREDRVYFVAHAPDVRIAGRPIQAGVRLSLPAEVEIRVGGQILEYRDVSRVVEDGWPYLAEIRRASSSTYMVFGGKYRIGRDRRCKVRLPDEPHNDNIQWRQDLRDSDSIRSRTGDIPKSRFYSDSIMVASEHAEIDLSREPVIRCVARHCFTYVRRGLDLLALYPAEREGAFNNLDLLPGDEILLGNSLFEVSYPPATGPRMPRSLTGDGPLKPPPPRSPAPVVAPASPPPPGETPAAAKPPEPLPAGGQARPEARKSGLLDNLEAPSLVGLQVGARPPFSRGATSPPAPPEPVVEAVPSVLMSDKQVELSRPARIVQIGWSVSREIVIGNHREADAIIPELRVSPGQRFVRRDYFRIRLRANRGQIVALHPTEVRLVVRGNSVSQCEDLEGAELDVYRRDADGELDFVIPLRLSSGLSLPDPRARLLSLGLEDRMVAALFTLGLPLGLPRRLNLGGIEADLGFDGERVSLSGYLESYQRPGGGFQPFFVRLGEAAVRTAPENGAPLTLVHGDLLICGLSVYRVELG